MALSPAEQAAIIQRDAMMLRAPTPAPGSRGPFAQAAAPVVPQLGHVPARPTVYPATVPAAAAPETPWVQRILPNTVPGAPCVHVMEPRGGYPIPQPIMSEDSPLAIAAPQIQP